jgi:thiamine kinase-like enzyme
MLADTGLAHWHVRIKGTGLLVRAPKQSQMDFAPSANLQYQTACFARSQASFHTPRLFQAIAPYQDLPNGALVVEEIVGQCASLPADLPAIATALAHLHKQDLPLVLEPLLAPEDPLWQVMGEIQSQMERAVMIKAGVRRIIEQGLIQLKQVSKQHLRPRRALIAFDTHPGNFVLQASGKAILVDLEKCRYSYPGFDLAHTTQYTSTTWDVSSFADLSVAQIIGFYDQWLAQLKLEPTALALERSWFSPARSAMWLWSLSWCAMWLCQAQQAKANNTEQIIQHVNERTLHYTSERGIDRVQRELDLLDRHWSQN